MNNMKQEIAATFTQVTCLLCDHTMPPTLTRVACQRCGSPWLDARYDYDAVARLWPEAPHSREASLWRYEELLPVAPQWCVTMSEGWSPLLPAHRLGPELGHTPIAIKDERQSPTSSFKDRQAALAVSALSAAGITECVLASTGNAAVAYAAYCARAGIKLWVFVTSLVSAAKMREAALYGAEVVKVTGTYDQTKDVAAGFARRNNLHFERGAKAIVGKESMKTIAFEIAEQLGWKAPDWYIQAVSGGIGPIGVWKGFTELHRMGLINRLPRLALVQVEGCNPMVRAFQAGQETADPVVPQTAITILSTGDPGHGYTLLYRAVKSNGGTMISVPDEAAFQAMHRLARAEGFSVEPATAVAFAGLEKLLEEGTIRPDEMVVVNASGHTLPVEKFILGDQYTLDIEASSLLAVGQPPSPQEGLGAALGHLDGRVVTIAVIDDSPHDSRLIRRMLQRHGRYQVFEARDGQAGIDLVRERRPDLVILDLMMPGVDGFDVLGALKADPGTAAIPVIVVSAKTLTRQEREQLERQTVSVWTKGNYKSYDLVEHIITQIDEAQHTMPEKAVSVQRPPASAGPGQTILIIDDNPLDGRLLRRTLEQRGLSQFRITEARSGGEALNMLQVGTPDLIILDLVLPDMIGFDVLEQLRELPGARDVPVVVLTAKDLSPEEQALLEEKVDFTWKKGTLDRSALREHVEQVIKDNRE